MVVTVGGQSGADPSGDGVAVRQWCAGGDGEEHVGDLGGDCRVVSSEGEQGFGVVAVAGGGVAGVEGAAA
ncbi:hypothetical protein ABZ749_17695 [Micromonospora sp. NPDC047753]|uniref:hypothetical protein n=1 Tax=Micromonospora sp. NPDC047753 TaxID=3154817 RepID=UPI0033E0E70F